MTSTTSIALKEWSAVCNALAEGIQTITLRKGGIRERGGVFRADHDAFLIYPTLEHQSPEALRPEFTHLLQTPVPPTRSVTFSLFSECVDARSIATEEQARALAPLTIWTEEYLAKRFHMYPERPLWLLLLRVHRIEPPLVVAEHPSYAGCRSWVPLQELPDYKIGAPILDDSAFRRAIDLVHSKV